MSAGLFGLTCPQCGGALEIDHRGMEICAGCAHAYLNRFGHLIPIDHAIGVTDSAGARTTFAPKVVERGRA